MPVDVFTCIPSRVVKYLQNNFFLVSKNIFLLQKCFMPFWAIFSLRGQFFWWASPFGQDTCGSHASRDTNGANDPVMSGRLSLNYFRHPQRDEACCAQHVAEFPRIFPRTLLPGIWTPCFFLLQCRASFVKTSWKQKLTPEKFHHHTPTVYSRSGGWGLPLSSQPISRATKQSKPQQIFGIVCPILCSAWPFWPTHKPWTDIFQHSPWRNPRSTSESTTSFSAGNNFTREIETVHRQAFHGMNWIIYVYMSGKQVSSKAKVHRTSGCHWNSTSENMLAQHTMMLLFSDTFEQHVFQLEGTGTPPKVPPHSQNDPATIGTRKSHQNCTRTDPCAQLLGDDLSAQFLVCACQASGLWVFVDPHISLRLAVYRQEDKRKPRTENEISTNWICGERKRKGKKWSLAKSALGDSISLNF